MFLYTVILRPAPLRIPANFFLKKILPKQIVLPEGVLLLNPQDPVISGALALGVYEKFQTQLFRELITPDMTVVDIGANIGYYTVLSAAHAAQVIAFEPDAVNRSFLEKNTLAFPNVRRVPLAVSDTVGTATLHLSRDNLGKHSLVSASDLPGTETIETVRLDDYLASIGVDRVDAIKMDIEGWEPRALEGMSATLRTARVLFTEFDPAVIRTIGVDPASFLDRLKGHGFDLYEVNEAKEKLESIDTTQNFSDRFGSGQYTNILCLKRAPNV